MVVDYSDSAVAPPLPSPGGLIHWDKIHRFPPHAAVSQPPETPWSMVAIRNYHDHENNSPPICFPPIDHENLQISPDPPPTPNKIPHIHTRNQQISCSGSDSNSDSGSRSSSTFSPSDSSQAPRSPLFSTPSARSEAAVARWYDSWTVILHSKLNDLVQFLCTSFTSSRGVFLTFRSATFTAMLIAFLYFRQRRRLKVGEKSMDRLIGVIKERDEKINQLLDQISQMNQMLLAFHRVPASPTP